MISKLLVVAGGGSYPRLVVEGARRAGVARVDVLSVKGSCVRATRAAADNVVAFSAGESDKAIEWTGRQGYDGVILAGQVISKTLLVSSFAR